MRIMDSDTVCFQDLGLRQKLFQEEIDDFTRIGNKCKSKIGLNVVPLNKKELYFKNVKELSEEATKQQIEEFALLQEESEYSKYIADINTKIGAMEETLQKLKDEESIGKDELKQTKKPLLKAIKKYSTNFNLDIEVKKHDQETLVASVKNVNKRDANSVDFLIDRKSRKIVDFSAEWLLSKDEAQKLKNNAQTKSGIDVDLILTKLKDHL